MPRKAKRPDSSPKAAQLRRLYEENGYVRVRNPETARRRGSDYRKGYEVRLVFRDGSEAEDARRALESIGLRPGRSFSKHSRVVLPVYGKAAVEWFAPERLRKDGS